MGESKKFAKTTKGEKMAEEKKAKERKNEKTEQQIKIEKPKSKQESVKKSSEKDKIKLSGSEKKHSKKYRQAKELVEAGKEYSASEAIELAKKTSTTKFDASIEVHVRLGVNPAAQDQQVRGTVVLPHGTGKTKRIAVVCGSDKEKEAKAAGADKVGESLIAEIEKGKLDFDILVATPDMMPKLGKVGKILGTKGLMPNPKAGTVTTEVGKAVKELKAGRVEFRVDKNGIVHQIIGKVSFDQKKLEENFETFLGALKNAKPSGAKGTYVLSVTLATTMGPGIKIAM